MAEKIKTGGCICGAIRYELDDQPTWNVYCHCESCRKHTGAPVTVLVTCLPEQVSWSGDLRARYQSSPDRFRGFCQNCGTSLTWETEIKGSAWLALHVSTLDAPENYPPTEHVFCENAIEWYVLNDGLPRYPGAKYSEFGVRDSGDNRPAEK